MDPIQQVGVQVQSLLAALRERDGNTANHSDRTTAFALVLGERCGLKSDELAVLRIAAVIHDIGKIGIPDRILLKPGKLEADEWTVMKSHPECGYRILMSIEAEGIVDLANVVRHHHESFDGSGYPDGLAGESIPVMSRIVALADSYDALATIRPYHPPRSHEAIMRILHEDNGGKYDPYLRTTFGRCLETSPFRAFAGDA